MTDVPIGMEADHTDQPQDGEGSDSQQPAGAHAVDLVVEGLRELGQDRSLAAVMALTTTAAASLPGAVCAALTVRAGDGFSTVAQTSDLPLAVDALQNEHGGPCIDAVLTAARLLHADDLRTEHRWPAFTTAALDHTPVLAMLSYRLSVTHDEDAFGSLNLYATKPHAFDSDTVTAGERLAAYTAVVLGYAAEREKAVDKALQLEQALHSSRDIGAAIGILMTRHLITREQAFTLLTTSSQQSNRKLRQIANQVIDTGDLPSTLDGPTSRSARTETRG